MSKDTTDAHADATAYLLTQLLEWQVKPENPRASAHSIGLRVLSAAWAINPDLLGGGSLHKLSLALGVSDSILSRYGQEFANRFGVFSRAQRSPSEIAARKVARAMHTPLADPSAN